MHVCFWYAVWFLHYLLLVFTDCLKASHQHVNQPRHRQCESQWEHTVLLLQQTRERDRQVGAGGVACCVGSGLPWQTLSLLLVSSAAHAAACVYHMSAHTALGTRGLHVSRNVRSSAWTARLDRTHTHTHRHMETHMQKCKHALKTHTHTSCSVQWSAWGNVHRIHSGVRSLHHHLCFRPGLWNAKWNL